MRSSIAILVVCDFCDDGTIENSFSNTGSMKKLLLLVLVAASASVADGAEFVSGTFEGRVVVEWLDDSFIPTMRLKEESLFR